MAKIIFDKCPSCEGEKDERAKRCKKCYLKEISFDLSLGVRECSKCKQTKDFSEFRFRKRHTTDAQPVNNCLACERERARNYCRQRRLDFIDRFPMKKGNDWKQERVAKRSKDPLGIRKNQIRFFARNLGYEGNDIDTIIEKYFLNDSCQICGAKQSELSRVLNIDHCHETNKIRGFLCGDCNIGLARFKDSRDNLKRAMDYLGNDLLKIK